MSITDNIRKIFRKINYKKNNFITTTIIKIIAVVITLVTLFCFFSRLIDDMDFLSKPAETSFIKESSQDTCINKGMEKIINNGNVILNMHIKLLKENCNNINKEKWKEIYMLQKNAINENIK